jgi:hypothetical protein
MMFSAASLAVLGLTIIGTAFNLYLMRRRPRGRRPAVKQKITTFI